MQGSNSVKNSIYMKQIGQKVSTIYSDKEITKINWAIQVITYYYMLCVECNNLSLGKLK